METKSQTLCRRLALVLTVCSIGNGMSKTYTVLNTNDAGQGSLRQAITDANNHTGPDEIRFNIPSSDPGFDGSVWWIRPQTALPGLTDGWTVINGSFQTSNQGDTNPGGPEIVLSGKAAGGSSKGILITSPNNTVQGLVISGFQDVGIAILLPQAAGNTILGNYIGTNPTGEDAAGNRDGIMIGLGAKRNTVGGPKPSERNILSGNRNSGVYVDDADSNQVVGNCVGTNAVGDDTLSNKYGILIFYGANHNTIGGTRSGDRNIISGNRNTGVFIGDADSNHVIGNFIGTDVTGKRSIGGEGHGITIELASNNRIGGLQAAESNLISGNGLSGIRIRSSGSRNNQIVGNRIGTDQSGASSLPNQSDGVAVFEGARQNQIGPANTIRYNQGNGISIYDEGTLYNRITQNSISTNTNSGIDLSQGGNGSLSPPNVSPASTGVYGKTIPNSTVEIFSDSLDEGKKYEGTAVSDADGNFDWPGNPAGPYVTATVTDPSGNTSEFSTPVSHIPGLWVRNTNDSGQGSLRWAIEQANGHQGPDSILFDIPASDPGFDGSAWWIQPETNLPPFLDNGTRVLGESQARMGGDKNPYGPEIGLNGREILNYDVGFDIQSSDNVVSGLILSGFRLYAISVSGERAENNRFIGNYIGTDATGTDTLQNGRGIVIESAKRNWIGGSGPLQGNLISGNSTGAVHLAADSNFVLGNRIGTDRSGTAKLGNGYGIQIRNAAGNWIGGSQPGERNVISGNETSGIIISGTRKARFNTVQGNFIGTDINGASALGSQQEGLWIGDGASGNLIGGASPDEANLISGHDGYGITISSSETDSNRIIGNRIGTDAGGGSALPNRYGGVYLSEGTKYNQIGPSNTIRFNRYGIQIYHDSTLYNRITQNSISSNEVSGILLFSNGNGAIPAPIFSSDASGVHGTTVPNGTVEIFSDESSQGAVYEGSAAADAGGNFSWNGTPGGPFITATVTDPEGNTSGFSSPIHVTAYQTETSEPIPANFYLFNNFPNPFNPSTAIRFDVKKSCRVTLKVYDIRGKEVVVLADKRYEAGSHAIRFDASGLASGLYLYRIEMGGFTATRKMAVMK